MHLEYAAHARRRMAIRRITEAEVEATISSSDVRYLIPVDVRGLPEEEALAALLAEHGIAVTSSTAASSRP